MTDYVWLDREHNRRSGSVRIGRVRLSLDLLADMLFPNGTRIIRAYEPESIILGCGELELVVTHTDLPAVQEGDPIPELHPTFCTQSREDAGVTLKRIDFESWGIPR